MWAPRCHNRVQREGASEAPLIAGKRCQKRAMMETGMTAAKTPRLAGEQ